MSYARVPKSISDRISRCDEQSPAAGHGQNPDPIERRNASLKQEIAGALWKDDVLRALVDHYDIDIHLKNGVVFLNGHIADSSCGRRIEHTIQGIPGIVKIKNDLILDDDLTLDVAFALGSLEHAYNCRFFTGASRGVVSINGIVRDEEVRLLAEKRASGNPKTRGVINNIRVSGSKLLDAQGQVFLQPAIGETIYFLDWVPGIVKQVIINPDNRRVIAMIIQWKFANQRHALNPSADGKVHSLERLVNVPMDAVRYLTRVSGFLSINSNEWDRYLDFDPGRFIVPDKDWVPPYPYCPDDVLFPVSHQQAGEEMGIFPTRAQSVLLAKEQAYSEEHLANDSLGG